MKGTVRCFLLLLAGAAAIYPFYWHTGAALLYGNAAEVIALVFAGWNLILASDRQPEDSILKKAWLLLSSGMWIWVFGELMETYCNVILGQVSYGTITDSFWVLGYAALLFGMFYLWRAQNLEPPSWKRNAAYIAYFLILYATIFVGWIFEPLLNPDRAFALKILDLLYPTLDFVLLAFALTALGLSVRNEKRSQLGSNIFLSAGFAILLISDLILTGADDFLSPLYRILPAAYLPAYFCVALAGASQLQRMEKRKKAGRESTGHMRIGLTSGQRLLRIKRLLEMSHKSHATLELEEALRIIIKEALHLTHMNRGFIMLFDEHGKLEFGAGYDDQDRNLSQDDFQVSHSLIEKSLKTEMLFRFISSSDVSSSSRSADILGIRCGFCIPLFACRSFAGTEARREILGILYVDARKKAAWGKEEEELVRTLALHAGLALENARLYKLATLDGLTRLYQRRYFDHAIEVEWRRSRRYDRPLTILLLDLDHFKRINDTYGHHEGDSVLRRTATVLKNACRAADIVARYGGEEFAVLLPDTTAEGALIVAQRVQMSLASSSPDTKPRVTVSIGLASVPPCTVTDVEQLVHFADVALYEAKKNGRNRLEIYRYGQVIELPDGRTGFKGFPV